jgi:ubiquinone/menaquinone biosynthesis C-methylase UbiE
VPAARVQIELLVQSAQDPVLPSDASIDTIVVTWTLCSIPNPPKARYAIKRVLKSDGQLILLEHGRIPDRAVAHWQDRLTPTWKRIAGGCHLNRKVKVDDLIEAAGFRTVN